jgi:Skp family chaperone for outer membrane proteins
MWLPARLLALMLILPLGMVAQGVRAQTATEAPSFQSPILTIDQERMFAESMFGKASLARLKEGEEALLAENLRIEGGLEQEERDLTARRATLPPEEFRALADAFDVKVEGVRSAQRAKYTALTAAQEADRRRFIEVALPTIGQLMQELGAAVVMDKQAVVVSLKQVDVTDTVIARLDAAIGDGSGAAPPEPQP